MWSKSTRRARRKCKRLSRRSDAILSVDRAVRCPTSRTPASRRRRYKTAISLPMPRVNLRKLAQSALPHLVVRPPMAASRKRSEVVVNISSQRARISLDSKISKISQVSTCCSRANKFLSPWAKVNSKIRHRQRLRSPCKLPSYRSTKKARSKLRRLTTCVDRIWIKNLLSKLNLIRLSKRRSQFLATHAWSTI